MTSNEALSSDSDLIFKYHEKAKTMMKLYHSEKEENFYMWLNKFEYVAHIIHVPKNKMAQFFISMVRSSVHTNFLQKFPELENETLQYKSIINRYFNFLTEKKDEINSLRFMSRNQFELESIKHYAICLQKLFKNSVHAEEEHEISTDEKLNLKFVDGLRENTLKIYLNKTDYGTFDETVEKSIEFAKANLISYYRDRAILQIDIYDQENGDEFYIWLNQFEAIAKMIGVPDIKMVDFFQNMVNNNVHACVEQTIEDVNFSALSYDEIIDYYLKYFYPNEVELHRQRIFCRKQYERETIDNYVRSLTKLFNNCNLTVDYEMQLIEQFIFGLREIEVKNYLREINYDLFDKIVEKANEFAKIHLLTYHRDRAVLYIDTYVKENEGDFDIWLNKFEFVANIIDVPESKMGKLLIKMIDNDVNMKVMMAYPHVNFNQLSFDKIINCYLRFFSPNESNLHRKRFESRKQYEHEPIEYYIFSIIKLLDKCNFPGSRNAKLLERFFKGIRINYTTIRSIQFLNETPDRKIDMAIKLIKLNHITNYLDHARLKIQNYHQLEGDVFYVWLNKFEHVACLIDIPDNKMIEFFYKMINNDVHVLVRENFEDVNFVTLSYDEIIDYYLEYYSPDTVDLYKQRIIFREQYERETIERYAYNLRKLIKKCIFTDDLEEMVMSRFTLGLREDDLRDHLNKNHCLTFDKMVEVAIEFAKVNLKTYYRDLARIKMPDFFSERKTSFHMWLNRFEYIANIIDVPDNKMIEFFNTMVDDDVHMRVKATLPNVQFSELEYEHLINHYVKYFSTEKVDLHEERLWERTQYEQEMIQNYAYNLRKLLNKCINTTIPESKLCKHFVNGLRDEIVKNHLRENHYELFDHMVEKANEIAKNSLVTYYRDEALLDIQTFVPEDDRVFHIWLNKFEYIAQRIQVPPPFMVEFFQLLIHNNVHKSVQLSFPDVNFSEISYNKLADYYIRFFSSEGNNIHEKRFFSRNQYKYEYIINYVKSIFRLIDKCDLKRNFEDNFRARFYNGIRAINIKTILADRNHTSFSDIIKDAYQLTKDDSVMFYCELIYLVLNIYNPRKEGSFHVWLNRFEYIADKLKVGEKLMLKLFKLMVHDDVHESVKKTYSSSDLSKFTYELTTEYYFFHFASPREVDFYKIRFMSRNQYKRELTLSYAISLTKLSKHCRFANGVLNELRSRFINGIRDNNLRNYFIQNPNISFKDIVKHANKLEMNKNNVSIGIKYNNNENKITEPRTCNDSN